MLFILMENPDAQECESGKMAVQESWHPGHYFSRWTDQGFTNTSPLQTANVGGRTRRFHVMLC